MEKFNYYFELILIMISLLFASAAGTAKAQGNNQHARKFLMDNNWKFKLGDITEAKNEKFDDAEWRSVNLPYDWSIEGKYSKDEPTGGSGGYLPTGIGWYRKHFNINKDELKKRIRVEFDGVYMNSDVWLNGYHLGNHPYGYTSFYYDLTPYIKEGENILSVRVDNSKQPNTRWYSGSGIYRNVWLVFVNPVHITHWGVYITTPEVSEESAVVEVRTTIKNDNNSEVSGTLNSSIFNKSGMTDDDAEIPFTLKAGEQKELVQKIKVTSPDLWSLENPVLYNLKSILKSGIKFADETSTDFGIRKIEFDTDKGFLLNGKHIKMKGVCLHHDGGCVGAAVPLGIWERRLEKLKEMGCNAIRTSHNPPAPEFLDLCDKMGFLVMDESFDEWDIGKRKYGYHDYFDEWSGRDLESMIHRDRNHPSIVLWSVGNEIPEQKTEQGAGMLKKLVDICHREDPTRPVTSACDNIAADGGSTTLAFLNGLDIVGYNYVDRWHRRRELYYSIDRHDHPNWKMIGTESVSIGGVRGDYSLSSDSASVHPNYNFEMIRAEQLWKFEDTRDYVIGDFMWTGIDYLGESFWPNKNGDFGVLDLCGFPKDGYYFYQSQWTAKPMIHLFPHWNWKGREGQIIPVLCYTNCDAVELFLNGKSMGEKRLQFPRPGTSGGWNKFEKPRVFPTTADLHLEWDVPYEPGVLKAVGKKDGKIVCTEEIRTAGPAAALRLKISGDTITTDPNDVANVKVEVVDAEGNIVPTADNNIMFSIKGEGKIIGVDNGNPADHSSYQSSDRNAFNGLCLAVVQSTGNAGDISLEAESEGLKSASVILKVIKGLTLPEIK